MCKAAQCLYILGIKKQFLAAVSLMYSVTFCLFGCYLLEILGKRWRKSVGKPRPSVDPELLSSQPSGPDPHGQTAAEPSLFAAQHQMRSAMLPVRLRPLLSMLSRKPMKVPSFDILTLCGARMLLCGLEI